MTIGIKSQARVIIEPGELVGAEVLERISDFFGKEFSLETEHRMAVDFRIRTDGAPLSISREQRRIADEMLHAQIVSINLAFSDRLAILHAREKLDMVRRICDHHVNLLCALFTIGSH